jgi:hypothetical protein
MMPGSTPLIANTAPRCHVPHPLPDIMIATTPQRSTPLHTAPTHTVTTQQPKIQLFLVDGGLQHNKIISQEATNFLINCVWANSPDIYFPTKLMPRSAPTCLNHEQVAMPIVYPITGENISSCKWLCVTPPWLKHGKQPLGKILVVWRKEISKQGKKALTQSLS